MFWSKKTGNPKPKDNPSDRGARPDRSTNRPVPGQPEGVGRNQTPPPDTSFVYYEEK